MVPRNRESLQHSKREPSSTAGLVSVVIPVRGEPPMLTRCLECIQAQTYPQIEVIIVGALPGVLKDNFAIPLIEAPFTNMRGPEYFDAPERRSQGAAAASGEYVYLVDSDMELRPKVVEECVTACNENAFDAIIVPEVSFGDTIWARAKALERSCYPGNDNVEAPRFVRMSTWRLLGGLDSTVGGNDDWDLHDRLQRIGANIGRILTPIDHNEGSLSLSSVCKKRYVYGKDTYRYIIKSPRKAIRRYSPVGRGYLRLGGPLSVSPILTVTMIAMRTVEYFSGGFGMIAGVLTQKRKNRAV